MIWPGPSAACWKGVRDVLDIRDHVLAVLSLVPGQAVPGRRVLQKILYFCSVMAGDVGVNATFRPHYYGPHSEPVARKTPGLVALGFLNAEPVSGGVTRFTYSLSDDGRKVVGGLRERYADTWSDIRDAVDRITSHSVRRNTLVSAATRCISFLVSMKNPSISGQEPGTGTQR